MEHGFHPGYSHTMMMTGESTPTDSFKCVCVCLIYAFVRRRIDLPEGGVLGVCMHGRDTHLINGYRMNLKPEEAGFLPVLNEWPAGILHLPVVGDPS